MENSINRMQETAEGLISNHIKWKEAIVLSRLIELKIHKPLKELKEKIEIQIVGNEESWTLKDSSIRIVTFVTKLEVTKEASTSTFTHY